MAKKIGNLAVFVDAKTAGLNKGLSGAAKTVKGFTSSVAASGVAIATGIGAVLAAGAAVGGAIYGLKGIADAIDKTAKTADALGVTTEALTGLHHTADLSGLGAEEFDASLTTMTKNVGLAAQGSGKAKGALEALGFNLESLSKISPENQLKAIADALDEVQNPTEKVALSMKIFGNSGRQMINVLKGGSKALEEQQAEAAKLGITFSRLDAAKVEVLNDNITRTLDVVKGLAQTLLIELTPYVNAGIQAFVEWAKSGNGFGDKVVSAVHWVASAVAYLADIVDLVSLGWTGMKLVALKVFEVVLDGVRNLIEGAHDLADTFGSLLPESFGKGLDSASNSVAKLANNVGAMAAEAGAEWDAKLLAKSSSEKVDEFFANAKRNIDEQAKAIADQAPKAQAYTDEIKNQIHQSSILTDELDQQAAKAQEIKDISFGDNNLIAAGSAQAQQLGPKTIADAIGKAAQKQIDLQKEQLKATKEVVKAVENDNTETVDF